MSTLLLVLAFVILAAAVSWIAGSSIKSPAEVAARTAPPAPSPILVPVEARVLSSDIVTRGTARFGLPQSISIVPSALKSGAAIIARLPLRNTQLREGVAALTVSGRPVFVLRGNTPVYRDLVPGISGEDVRQLEDGLKRMGFDPGPLDGTFDKQTSIAVANWYTEAGWQPFGPTVEQLANIRGLQRALTMAMNDKLAAADVANTAPLSIKAARAKAEEANKAAAANVALTTALRDNVFAKPKSSTEARGEASAGLEVAKAAAEATRLAGEMEIQSALNAQKIAEREAKMAEETVARLEADLENIRQKTGVQIPADEIIFISALPVRVEQINAAVGEVAGGQVMTVTNNQLAIDSSLPLNEGAFVKPGMAVSIDEPTLGIKARGVVERVANFPGTDGVDGYHIYFEVRVVETAATLEGISLRLTIPIESTGGAVIAVPASALSLAADGTSRVMVDNNGILEYVVVAPGLSADGFVEVTPMNGKLTPGQLVVIGYEKEY